MNELNLTSQQVARIIRFLGYGNLSAPVWFIGLEEGLGAATPDEAIANLGVRGTKFEETMDLHEAHKLLVEDGKRIDITSKNKFTPVWLWMAKIMRAVERRADWKDLEHAKHYVRHYLGRHSGRTFLTELSPIPQKGIKGGMFGELIKIEPRLDEMITERRKRLQQLLQAHQRKLVVCYGARPDEFAELLHVQWKPSPVKRCFTSEDGRRLLLPFFGVGAIGHDTVHQLMDHKLLTYHSE